MLSASSTVSCSLGNSVMLSNFSKSGFIHSHVYRVSLSKYNGQFGSMFRCHRTAAKHIAANFDGAISCCNVKSVEEFYFVKYRNSNEIIYHSNKLQKVSITQSMQFVYILCKKYNFKKNTKDEYV